MIPGKSLMGIAVVSKVVCHRTAEAVLYLGAQSQTYYVVVIRVELRQVIYALLYDISLLHRGVTVTSKALRKGW
jgi:hypothetical protein